MKKDLHHYLALPYEYEIVPIPDDEGGGYFARIPQFGALGIVGDGDTKEEALADLIENQKDRFQQYLNEGVEIPEPEMESAEYSGRSLAPMLKLLKQ
jgi:predicted RNase H-like HicB family nuclease